MTDITTVTLYNEHFIPFELFLVIFIAAFTFLALSFFVRKGNLILAGLSFVLFFFTTFASFFLGQNVGLFETLTHAQTLEGLQTVTTVNTLTNVQLITTVPALLYLCIGLTALAGCVIWYHIAYGTVDTFKEALDKNKEVKKDGGIR